MGLHQHAGHSFIIDVQKIRPLGEDNYAAKLVRLHRHVENAPGIDLEVPLLPEKYGVTASQAEGRMIRTVKAYLEGKPDPDEQDDE